MRFREHFLIFSNKKDPLRVIWFAGSYRGKKKLSKAQVLNLDLVEYGKTLCKDTKLVRKLRISSTLLLGMAVIYKKKIDYFLNQLKDILNSSRHHTITSQDGKILSSPGYSSVTLTNEEIKGKPRSISLPDKGSYLLDEMNSHYFDELFFQDENVEQFKKLIEEGENDKTEFGFNINFEETDSIEDDELDEEDEGKNFDISFLQSTKSSEKKMRNRMMDEDLFNNEVIDFGDDFNEDKPSVQQEEEEGDFQDDLMEGGDEIMFDDELEDTIAKLSKDTIKVSKKRKSRKRKRMPIIDKEIELSDYDIKGNINNTSKTIVDRPVLMYSFVKNPHSFFQRDDSHHENLENLEFRPFFYDQIKIHDPIQMYFQSSLSNEVLKKRKIEYESPDIARGAPEIDDFGDDLMDDGGDMLLDDDFGNGGDFEFNVRSSSTKTKRLSDLLGGEDDLNDPNLENPFHSQEEDEELEDDEFTRHIAIEGSIERKKPRKHYKKLEKKTLKYHDFLEHRFEELEQKKREEIFDDSDEEEEEENEKEYELNKLVEPTNKHIASLAFYHSLVLCNKQVLKVKQKKPFSDIMLSKGEFFDE